MQGQIRRKESGGEREHYFVQSVYTATTFVYGEISRDNQ